MPRITVRKKILEYLKKQNSASASKIGSALNMAIPDVRHHLSILLEDGRIKLYGEIHNKRRGRPVKVYRLSEKLLGDNLALLSSGLLSELLNGVSDKNRQAALQSLAKRISDQMGRIEPNMVSTKRLAALVDKLDEHHYQAKWEAGAEGPRILFRQCPYAAIIDNHPELCRMDGMILEEEMGGQARQLAKMDQKAGGNIHCVFLVS